MSHTRAPAPDDGAILVAGGDVGRDLMAVDWEATAVGPPGSWPRGLTTAVRILLGSRFAMWMAWGPELTFFCNDAYRRDTLGKKYPWALGRSAREVWAEIWPDIGPRIDAVMSSGEATWDEALLLFLERSGYVEETYHTFSYSPLYDDDGTIAGMLCVVSEDTERVVGDRRMATLRELGSDTTNVRTEAEVLAAAAEHLSSNRRSLPFALFYLFDEGGTTARLACAAGIETGHRAVPATIDVGDRDPVWPAADLAAGVSVLVDDIERRHGPLPTGEWDEPPEQALVVPLPQQGRERPAGFLVAALNRYRPIDESARSFVGLIAGQVAAGISTARAYEAERRRAEDLADLDRAKTAFFTNVSHELRTPLTLLLGPAEDALGDDEEPLPAAQRRRVEVVHRNALRLLKLVNSLLDFSRLESGRLAAHYEPVDLARYTAELASMFESALERAGLTLSVDCRPLPEPVYVDREMWAKIVLNLLSNALKFTFEGSIAVRLDLADGEPRLSVADTGIGIAPADQARLFERFTRVLGVRARTHEGSGIGLALVSELAGLHGGEVGVDSTPGQGTTFTVSLRFGTAHLPADQVAPAAGHAGSAARQAEGFLAEAMRWLDESSGAEQPESAPNAGGRPLVLVVDDNADMRDYISTLLAGDYAVATAPDGAVALELVRAHPPDLVLTDVMMPNLDGFGLLAALHADPASTHIPVVMLSARAGEEGMVEGLEAGADDYLIKPFTARELLARVRANLELDRVRRTRDELERSRTLLDQAEQLARVGSWEVDLVSDAVRGSAEFLRLLGAEAEALRAGGLAAAMGPVHADDYDRVAVAVARAAEDGTPMDLEFRIEPAGGAPRTVRVHGVLRRDREGRPASLRGSVQDVTEQREAEAVRRVAAATAEAAAREHSIADQLQRSLLPSVMLDPGYLDLASYYRSGVEGTQVGGDWYDVIELGAGRAALVIGDVMGRGVHAAAIMGQVRAAVRAFARLDLRPGDMLELLDGVVRDLGADQIVTCVYAIFDPADRTLVYANAGHLPPLLAVPGEPTRRLTGGAPPLGSGPLDVGEHQLEIPVGGVVAFYTDGLVERRGGAVDVGIDRLASLLATATGPIEEVPGSLVEALLPEEPDDDVAVLVARVPDPALHGSTATLVLESEPRAVGEARAFVAARLESLGADPEVVKNAVLLTSELVTNAVLYGRPPILLRVRTTSRSAVIEVHDGTSVLPRKLRPTPDDEHGRGLQLVASLSERWGTRPLPQGKSVWCMLALGPGSAPAS